MSVADSIAIEGLERFLGCHQSTRLLACPIVNDDNPDAPLIDESEWVEQDPIEQYLTPVLDQNGTGECNCFAAEDLLATQRLVSGFEFCELHPGDLYRRINGGRDQGSTLEDALSELQQTGIADRDPNLTAYEWHKQNSDISTRSKNKILKYTLCPSYKAIMSESQRGFAVAFGTGVGGNFAVDSRGYIPPARGRTGGHAMIILPFAMKVIDGKKCPAAKTSWINWGVKRQAWGWLDPSYLIPGGWGAYSARSITLPDSLKVRA